MLEPQSRHHLLEALRPPTGYTLDAAIGTTFSLDLLALLTAPVAFTLFEWSDAEGRPTADPLALLEAMRRTIDRITIFSQAGRIQIPPGTDHKLCAYLESSIVEVTPSRPNGVFHPKVWALRFTAEGKPVQYRLLCLSRNLTFDRSWDTILTLGGTLVERQNAFGVMNPLGDFIQALPSMAIRRVSDTVSERVERMQHELRRVQFQVPDGFESFAFWPLGLRGKPWPFEGRRDRMLVISPFLSDNLLQRLQADCGGLHLLSRTESLDALKTETLQRCQALYQLSPMAVPEATDEEPPSELAGLHAKVYVADRGWDAVIWTGSANATNAAFENNVELLVELRGKRSRCGIDTILGQDKDTSLRDLLIPYTSPTEPVAPNAAKVRLEGLVEDARRALAKATLVVRVQPGEEAERYHLGVYPDDGTPMLLPAGVSVTAWPITLPEERRQALAMTPDGALVTFAALSFEAITAFFAFTVEATDGKTSARARFVLNLPLIGAPDDRRERVLLSLLRNRDAVLRYLFMLLAEGGTEVPGLWEGMQRLITGAGTAGHAAPELPLFEYLMRAAERDPAKLDQVDRLVTDLCAQPDGTSLLPDGFLEVWEPIRAAVREPRVPRVRKSQPSAVIPTDDTSTPLVIPDAVQQAWQQFYERASAADYSHGIQGLPPDVARVITRRWNLFVAAAQDVGLEPQTIHAHLLEQQGHTPIPAGEPAPTLPVPDTLMALWQAYADYISSVTATPATAEQCRERTRRWNAFCAACRAQGMDHHDAMRQMQVNDFPTWR